jgi:hypothetical protein
MMVRIPLEKLRSVTPVKKTKTLADLKLGLAQKKWNGPFVREKRDVHTKGWEFPNL